MIQLSGEILNRIFQYIQFSPEHPICQCQIPEIRSLSQYAPYWTFSNDSDLDLLPSYIYCLEIKDNIYIRDDLTLNVYVRYLKTNIQCIGVAKSLRYKTIILKKAINNNISFNDLNMLSQVTGKIQLYNRLYGDTNLKNILQSKCSGVLYLQDGSGSNGFHIISSIGTTSIYIYPRQIGKPFEMYYDQTLITDEIMKILSDIVGINLSLYKSLTSDSYYSLILTRFRIVPSHFVTKYMIMTSVPLSVTVDEVVLRYPTGVFTRASNISLSSWTYGNYSATHIHMDYLYKLDFTAPNVLVVIIHNKTKISRVVEWLFNRCLTLQTVLIKRSQDQLENQLKHERFSKIIIQDKYYELHRVHLIS